jgi:hypothetical protein
MDFALINLDCTVCITLANHEGRSRLGCGMEYFYPRKRKCQIGENYLLKIVVTLRVVKYYSANFTKEQEWLSESEQRINNFSFGETSIGRHIDVMVILTDKLMQ